MQVPQVASDWERDAGIDDIAAVVETAETLGYDFVTCAEHVAVPDEEVTGRGSVYWDPLATLAFLAARTSRIRLVTSVLVLGYHHPLAIAKQYGTLDRVSGGRLVLGVGVGSLAAEFALLDAQWPDRGVRADDAIRALRASLSQRRPSYSGDYFRYGPVIVDPCAVQPRVPIWVGGRTRRSLRRAVALADGWMPFGLRVAEIAELLGSVRLPAGFDVVLSTGRARSRRRCRRRGTPAAEAARGRRHRGDLFADRALRAALSPPVVGAARGGRRPRRRRSRIPKGPIVTDDRLERLERLEQRLAHVEDERAVERADRPLRPAGRRRRGRRGGRPVGRRRPLRRRRLADVRARRRGGHGPLRTRTGA